MAGVREVYLGMNVIGDAGGRALAASLPQSSRLQKLSLLNNTMSDDAAASFAEVSAKGFRNPRLSAGPPCQFQ